VVVAWLRWLKGIEHALHALSLLDPSVMLDVYGGDPLRSSPESSERPRLVHAIEELGLGERVTLHGHVEPEDVRDALRGADVLLHPSLSEGMPTVMLEAMACALPVVVTDVGGVREAVTDGVEGIVVPSRDPRALAAALERLRRDPALGRRMGEAGRRRVQADFTLQRQLDQFEDFYLRLVRRPGGAPAEASLQPIPEGWQSG
jgi:colanic acid/amylovoran biosynthesis glycosyltransferase